MISSSSLFSEFIFFRINIPVILKVLNQFGRKSSIKMTERRVQMITKIFPYLNFDGDGKEAAHFYTDVLGAELIGLMTYGEAAGGGAGEMPEEAKDLVMNAQIVLKNGDQLMISDVPPGMGMPFQKGNNISLTLTLDDKEEARTIFTRLAEGGTINMDLHETFWSPLYGNLHDRFGIDWQISVEPEKAE